MIWGKFCLFVLFCFVGVFLAVRGPLTAVAPPIVEHRLRTHRLSSHGPRAQPLHGMWDLPEPGHEPVSPASAGGLPTTAPPGKPPFFNWLVFLLLGVKSSLYILDFFVCFFVCFFLAVLGLHCCTWAFSSCGERGLLFIAVRGFLIAVASLAAGHGL